MQASKEGFSVIPIKNESAWQGTSDCRSCQIRNLVLFSDLEESDFEFIHAPIDDLNFPAGEKVYSEGRSTVRQGILKIVRVSQDGRERIVRVLRAGDVAGLEALANQHYDTDAYTLTDVKVCRIPLSVIDNLASNSPKIHKSLMIKWQKTLRDADDWLADLNFGSAKQRVARFVLKMRDDFDPSLTTMFSREDMGAMLDLTLETISREVAKLINAGVLTQLDKRGRQYRINRPDLLVTD
jgi:CRP-like cAMP-binding protein